MHKEPSRLYKEESLQEFPVDAKAVLLCSIGFAVILFIIGSVFRHYVWITA